MKIQHKHGGNNIDTQIVTKQIIRSLTNIGEELKFLNVQDTAMISHKASIHSTKPNSWKKLKVSKTQPQWQNRDFHEYLCIVPPCLIHHSFAEPF